MQFEPYQSLTPYPIGLRLTPSWENMPLLCTKTVLTSNTLWSISSPTLKIMKRIKKHFYCTKAGRKFSPGFSWYLFFFQFVCFFNRRFIVWFVRCRPNFHVLDGTRFVCNKAARVNISRTSISTPYVVSKFTFGIHQLMTISSKPFPSSILQILPAYCAK